MRANLARLVCIPGGQLLDEGRLVLATEGGGGDLGQLVLRAIAADRTKHGESGRIVHELERKATALPRIQPDLRYVACERPTNMPSTALAVTAADIFP